MSLMNPTRLQIGMHGQFSGRDYRLRGRAVLGVTEAGATYYWNEFHLEARDGTMAILVYEETERGVEWRIFHPFVPEYPMTAEEAAGRRTGERINLTGTDVEITRVDTALVYRVEGQVAGGMKVNETSDYFNAEAGDVMQVVSWIGEVVEFYDGVNLSAGEVRAAFRLPADPALGTGRGGWLTAGGSGNQGGGWNWWLVAGVTAIVAFILFAIVTDIFDPFGRRIIPLRRLAAGDAPLTVGAAGTLQGKAYRVTAHAVVEIAEVGVRRERHEYQLTDDAGQPQLLVCGLAPGDNKWVLFTALHPLVPPTAQACAAQKIGSEVNVDGVTGPVREIFQSTVSRADGGVPLEWLTGTTEFGYLARSQFRWLQVHWNAVGVAYESGMEIPAREVTAALAAPGR